MSDLLLRSDHKRPPYLELVVVPLGRVTAPEPDPQFSAAEWFCYNTQVLPMVIHIANGIFIDWGTLLISH